MQAPTLLRYRRSERILEVQFPDQAAAEMTAEFLRVHSPSAEVQGHGGSGSMLLGGKREVAIEQIEAVGNYAIRIHFDDGHNTGLYTWPILDRFIRDHDKLWQAYIARLAEHDMSRDKGAVTKLSALLEADRKA